MSYVRSDAERRANVRAVLAHGQRIASDFRAAKLAAGQTGLSEESAAYALSQCLERNASDEDLDRVFAWAGEEVEGVAVILSAGVFTAAIRAIALALAAGRRVVVRPSTRDQKMPRLFINEMPDLPVSWVESLDLTNAKFEQLHVYGRDATIAAIRARSSARVRAHGHGFGIALVNATEASDAFADDVIAFDQRGCLSPRVAFVIGESNGAVFAAHLHDSLTAREKRIPRGALSAEERSEAARYADAVTFAGTLHRGDAHLVGVASGVVTLPPPGRHLHVVAVPDIAAARDLIAPFAHYVTAIGTDDFAAASALDLPYARVSALGQMQRPPFDGPVDRRPETGR